MRLKLPKYTWHMVQLRKMDFSKAFSAICVAKKAKQSIFVSDVSTVPHFGGYMQ